MNLCLKQVSMNPQSKSTSLDMLSIIEELCNQIVKMTVSAVGRENGKTAVKPQAGYIGRPKDMVGTKSPNIMDYPQGLYRTKIVGSGC
ncbi:hypothetical protein Tco_1055718 [Tanacetum coccineum]|uniref:Uncharacterized protein n=1 Tax=Tanacetum coccineum TaxID=301880 RepID=A0ABQ5H0G5_9ASTR